MSGCMSYRKRCIKKSKNVLKKVKLAINQQKQQNITIVLPIPNNSKHKSNKLRLTTEERK